MPFWQYANPDWDQDSHTEISDPRQKLQVNWHTLDVAIEPWILIEWTEDNAWPYKDVMVFTSWRVLMMCQETWKIRNSPIWLNTPTYAWEISAIAILVAARAAGILPEANEYSVH